MASQGFLPRASLDDLLDALRAHGYRCVGPRLRDGAIVYGELARAAELPQGVRDDQQPGAYRYHHVDSSRQFAWANGVQALKPWVFAPSEPVWRAQRDEQGGVTFETPPPAATPTAFIGARACDLAGLRLQDQHFLEAQFPDDAYGARRAALFLVAVNCTHPAATCFCASTGDGPTAEHSYDLVMDELDDGFILQSGSERGAQVLDGLDLPPASEEQRREARHQSAQAADAQIRSLPSRNLRDALFANLEHPRWADVAARCLSCGNCTSVCPTCFCHSLQDQPNLKGTGSDRVREWDSCFTEGHSYIHGIVIRADTRQRYRQWLTHKLGSWHDQYGRSGCVGCGRCITWCPTGIDITEEAAAICGEKS